MNYFEYIKNMTLDELARWLDEYGRFDNSPWMEWFDKNYCQQCPAIKAHYPETPENEFDVLYCESNENKCRYFDHEINNLDILKLWLVQTVEEKK